MVGLGTLSSIFQLLVGVFFLAMLCTLGRPPTYKTFGFSPSQVLGEKSLGQSRAAMWQAGNVPGCPACFEK